MRLVKRIALTIPYVRRVHTSLEDMRRHIAALEKERNDRPGPAPTDFRPLPAPAQVSEERSITPPDPLELVHAINEAWCDLSGVFLSGWVHAGASRVQTVTLICGPNRVTVEPFGHWENVRAHYPHIPEEGAALFKAYLPCPPFQPVMIEVVHEAGTGVMAVEITPPTDPEERDALEAVNGFIARMKEQHGSVLELGARIVGSMTEGWRDRLEPDCQYIGNDIHPGPGIDVVGDVHNLSDHVARGSLDGIFSIAVLEHLAAPWIAASEINKALKLGGETLHLTHQTWPVHETPNDFFRMSDQALRSLFGLRSGFEVIDCGMATPLSIVPQLRMRHRDWLHVPTGRGYGQSFIRARKIRDIEATDESQKDLVGISQAYPMPKI